MPTSFVDASVDELITEHNWGLVATRKAVRTLLAVWEEQIEFRLRLSETHTFPQPPNGQYHLKGESGVPEARAGTQVGGNIDDGFKPRIGKDEMGGERANDSPCLSPGVDPNQRPESDQPAKDRDADCTPTSTDQRELNREGTSRLNL